MSKDVVWMGDSRKRLMEFPKGVKQSMGCALMLAQFGGMPEQAKPFKGVGSGVFELVESYQKNAYRMVYAVQLGNAVYVLHAFQKKSISGIKTPKPDVDLIKQRYKDAQEVAKHEKSNRL